MDNLILLGSILILITISGFYLAYLYGRKTKHFRWNEYIAIIILPIISIFLFGCFIDVKIFTLFLVSSFLGFFLEYLLGLTYHKALGKRLWKYDRFSVQGYTSLLSIPV
jgi:hypothetical protein